MPGASGIGGKRRSSATNCSSGLRPGTKPIVLDAYLDMGYSRASKINIVKFYIPNKNISFVILGTGLYIYTYICQSSKPDMIVKRHLIELTRYPFTSNDSLVVSIRLAIRVRSMKWNHRWDVGPGSGSIHLRR